MIPRPMGWRVFIFLNERSGSFYITFNENSYVYYGFERGKTSLKNSVMAAGKAKFYLCMLKNIHTLFIIAYLYAPSLAPT